MSDSTVPAEQNHERSEAGADHPDPMRWWILTVLAIAQLMIVLDASIVNIALPSAQEDLGISDADRQWIVTAYTLAFGGLLLLGGRIADYTGRKRTFIIGLLGFAGRLRARWARRQTRSSCSRREPCRAPSPLCWPRRHWPS